MRYTALVDYQWDIFAVDLSTGEEFPWFRTLDETRHARGSRAECAGSPLM
jgi:hypothetical protein